MGSALYSFIHSFNRPLLRSYYVSIVLGIGDARQSFILEFLKPREVGFGTCRRIDIISVYKVAMVDVYFSSPTNRGGGDGSFFPKDPGPETLLGRVLVK